MSGTVNKAAPERQHVLATEEAALRQVAMLVVRGAPTADIFDAAVEQVARIFDRPWVGLMRYDTAESFVVVATWGDHPLPVGSRCPATVFDDPEASAIGVPIVVDEATWGVIAVPATREAPLPAGAETRLSVFTELVATAISNADARAALAQLAEEQAALRRVATLVARQSSPAEIFGAVTDEARRVLASEAVGLLRFDQDETATLVAQSETPWDPPPVGTRFTLDGENVVVDVFRRGETARVDDWTDSTGAVAAMASVLGVRSAVAAPVVVEGVLWGTIIAASSQEQPLPAATESRLAQFTALVATAIANAGARAELSRLVEEQAALRRVAVLVARQPTPVGVFAAVTEAVGPLLGADLAAMHVFRDDGVATVVASWSQAGPTLPVGTELPLDGDSAVSRIFHTAVAARIDSYADADGGTADVARGLRLRTAVGAPILVEGKLWGALMAATRADEPLPDDAEARIAAFTDLVATAIANAEARAEVARLADEQAALRRIATLVARRAEPEQVLAAVTEETAAAFDAVTAVLRFEHDPPAFVIVGISHDTGTTVGMRRPLVDGLASTEVYRTGRPARRSTVDWTTDGGPVGEALLWPGVTSAVACPITVEGSLWGVVTLNAERELPPDTEQRLEEFTELVTTAIANAEAGVALRTAADEQGALRRVATLVAASTAPSDVFAAVTEEIALVLGADASLLCRADRDGAATVVGAFGERTPEVGTRLPQGGTNLTTMVLESGRSARIESYADATGEASEVARTHGLRSAVGAPILVEGRLWGLVLAGTTGDEPLPSDAEERLSAFTELVATAISNAEARGALRVAVEEQGALRRVATLVAASAPPAEVFAAVTREVALVLGADASLLCRADGDAAVVVGTWAKNAPPAEPGFRLARGGTNLMTLVLETGRPARIDNYDDATGDAGDVAQGLGVRSAVGAPILVEGGLWGLVIAGATGDEPLPSDAEDRLAAFTELVATALSNATARDELIASRVRIVAAGDEARRRIERNLHDGTQQRLIALGLDLQRARAAIPEDQRDAQSALVDVEHDLDSILTDLRELSHGLHPPLLSRLGLGPSLQAFARRSPIPVRLEVDLPERPAESVETAMYYVVSEALTNAVKHSHASEISVTIMSGERLTAVVADDGIGGADPSRGSGLTGLLDRIDALGGRFTLDSPPRGGTRIAIELPLEPPVAF